jgi:hypothetical protein
VSLRRPGAGYRTSGPPRRFNLSLVRRFISARRSGRTKGEVEQRLERVEQPLGLARPGLGDVAGGHVLGRMSADVADLHHAREGLREIRRRALLGDEVVDLLAQARLGG